MNKQFEQISIFEQIQEEQDWSIINQQITIDDHSKKIKSGYGSCFIKYCTCTGWRPNNPKNDFCKNCGHHWSQHY